MEAVSHVPNHDWKSKRLSQLADKLIGPVKRVGGFASLDRTFRKHSTSRPVRY